MKGLLYKDLCMIRSALALMLATVAVVGGGMAAIVSSWVVLLVATIVPGTNAITTVSLDKAYGWQKMAWVLPLPHRRVIDSKYALYLLLSLGGFALGFLLGLGISALQGPLDLADMLLFMGLSLSMALLTGSVTLPCSLLFSEEKNTVSLIVAYPLAAAVFVLISLLLKDRMAACALATALGAALFALSWALSRRAFPKREVR